ncbi:hypothetical protein SBA4_5760015 [Candidatus Sulfopaludibacter sp. SbA4]|nr:hypothetical protein SBA4_5760015 [Candidatus Sulfopaludibacter sp. SbA4]
MRLLLQVLDVRKNKSPSFGPVLYPLNVLRHRNLAHFKGVFPPNISFASSRRGK